ncbi:MAG: serpin family protein [Myxococcota bacterium]|nr:serpin family protein [Myxococcota bacterium]
MFLFSLLFACKPEPTDPVQPAACEIAERETITDENILAVVEGNQDFAFDLYEKLNGDASNLFLSPYSISTALGMLQLGTQTETETEMANVLGVFEPKQDWHAGQGAISQELSLINNCDYQINTANKVYSQSGFGFEADYLEGLSSLYNSQAEELDFGSDPEGARETINTWVSEQTMENIPDLIPAGVITGNTRMVLTNAIYMNAPWLEAFDPNDTYTGNFMLADGQTTPIEMMSNAEANISVGYQDGFMVAEIPYKGEELSLTVLLPNEASGLPAIEEQLNAENWREWKGSLYQTDAMLGIPKMEMRYKKELSETLKDLGMPSAFDPSIADLNGIADGAGLFVSAVIHEAWLKFSEEGTEAAAATAVVVADEAAMGEYIILDRPFLFAIEDKLSGSILFMGKVTDPSQL